MSDESSLPRIETAPEFLSVDARRVFEVGLVSREEARLVLANLGVDSLFTIPVVDRSFAEGCLAGLWLRHGFLEESHEISQQLKFREGSYWHGLMHREEEDYWNSKYWLERTGAHPIHELIFTYVKQRGENQDFEEIFGGRSWEPSRFVDWVERVDGGTEPGLRELRDSWKAIEWELLFRFCATQAVGA